jgi:hypothetical protein
MTMETPNQEIPEASNEETPVPSTPALPPSRQTMTAEEQLALAEVRVNLALVRYEIHAARCEVTVPKQGKVRL